MAQPTIYTRQYDFTAYQVTHVADPLPANQLDAELNAIKQTLDQLLANIALIQRDDGDLANESVGLEQLAESIQASFETVDPFLAPYFRPTSTDIPERGLYLRPSDYLGFAVEGALQLEIRDSMWEKGNDFNGDPNSNTWCVIGGGNSGEGLEGSVTYGGASDMWDHITLRLTATGQYGGVHAVANGYVQANFGGGPRNTDTDAQLNTYVNLQGNIPGASPTISAQRSANYLSDAHGLLIYTTGKGDISFATDNLLSYALSLKYAANSVNHFTMTPGATGVGATLGLTGSDTNIAMRLASKGSGAIDLMTNSSVRQVQIGHTGSAVNYLVLSGNAAANPASIYVEGTDTNVGMRLSTKGTGTIEFLTGTLSRQQFTISDTAGTIVNRLDATGSATGAGPVLSAAGSDSNIDMNLTPKGTGKLKLGGGSFAANGSVATSLGSVGPTGAQTTVQEWLAIKSGSNTRYIPCF